MQEVIAKLVDVPFARMFVLAGIVFLLLAVLGKVEGKIDPGQTGRIGALALGLLMMAVGVVLQYTSMHDIDAAGIAQQARQGGHSLASELAGSVSSEVRTVVKAGVSPPAHPAAATLKVVSGTYGRSCNAKPGNDTVPLARACNGKASCDYAVTPVAIEGAPAGCAADFAAEWKCGSGAVVYSATLPPAAVPKETLHLACAG